MNAVPNSWEEVVDTPEIPVNFEGKIIKTVEYSRNKEEPKISFPCVIYETQIENEESKWYISNTAASFLQSSGYRESCIMPIEAKRADNFCCYIYNYEITKRYSEWFLAKKGKFIVKNGTQIQNHFLLLFFCEDENWAPFHHDLTYVHAANVVLLKPTTFSVTKITKQLLGHKEIRTNSESYKSAEIGFIRALTALTAYAPEFIDQTSFQNFVTKYLSAYNKLTGAGISIKSFLSKVEDAQFQELCIITSPHLKPAIYRYFFSLNTVDGSYVRHALEKYPTVSLFNIIYRFLNIEKKAFIHFDETILKEAGLFVDSLKKFASVLGDRLPYAELLVVDLEASWKNWENLAAVALFYLHITNKNLSLNISDYNNVLKKLKAAIPNFTEKVTNLALSFSKSEIYDNLQEMNEVHDAMQNIPWDDYKLELKYINWYLHLMYSI